MADQFVEDDTASVLEYTARDALGAPISLTGKTLKVIWLDATGAKQTRTMTNDPDQVTNKGKAAYQFVAGELKSPGTVAEFEITAPEGILTSRELSSWNVRKRL